MRNPQRNIVITGFYGCKASSVAKDLAMRLKRPFVDVPKEINRRSKMNLFNFTGIGTPPSHKKLTQWVIRDLSYRRRMIISLDSPVLINTANADELKVFSYLVFLDPPFDELWSNMQAEQRLQPIMEKHGKDGLHDMWLERNKVYENCNLQLFSDPKQIRSSSRLVEHCFLT